MIFLKLCSIAFHCFDRRSAAKSNAQGVSEGFRPSKASSTSCHSALVASGTAQLSVMGWCFGALRRKHQEGYRKHEKFGKHGLASLRLIL